VIWTTERSDFPCVVVDGMRLETHDRLFEIADDQRAHAARDDTVELGFSPIAFGDLRLSCHCGLPGPAELGAINPYAVHDHGQCSSGRTMVMSWARSG
jgi:hypothetical protein